jgi:hypothetical protein
MFAPRLISAGCESVAHDHCLVRKMKKSHSSGDDLPLHAPEVE